MGHPHSHLPLGKLESCKGQGCQGNADLANAISRSGTSSTSDTLKDAHVAKLDSCDYIVQMAPMRAVSTKFSLISTGFRCMTDAVETSTKHVPPWSHICLGNCVVPARFITSTGTVLKPLAGIPNERQRHLKRFILLMIGSHLRASQHAHRLSGLLL